MSFMGDFWKSIKIKASETTPFLALRSSSLLRFLQEISIEHTEELGFPRSTTLDKGLLWVIAKQHIEIKRMPKYDETIVISTYPSKRMHVLFPRSYEIKDEKGQVIISSVAIWALIDAKTRKTVNPSLYSIDIPDMSEGREFKMPLRKIASNTLSKECQIEATYSRCDLNGHMNNTSYLDIAEDLIPLSFLQNRKLVGIDIEYLHEIKLGEKISASYELSDNLFALSSDNFKLELTYKNNNE